MTQVLFLVHGMGINAGGPDQSGDRNAWAKDVEKALLDAAAAYPNLPQGELVLVPILYDDVFVARANTWAALADQLAGTGLSPLVSWMKSVADPGFLYSSIGDVIQYRAFSQIRDQVVTHVATQIATKIAELGTGANVKYTILAHSLGTAVAHDAVQKLVTTPIAGNNAFLDGAFRFETFFALANVSRLVWANDAQFYDETRVRPPGCGLPPEQCAVQRYVTVRHVADPVPSVVRFSRKSWSPDNYLSTEVRHVRDVNLHAFTHYLQSPLVSDLLLYQLFGGQVVTRLRMLQRVQAFPDYVGPHQQDVATAVSTVESALNAISAQSEGKFALDLDDIAKALWDYRGYIEKALKGL